MYKSIDAVGLYIYLGAVDLVDGDFAQQEVDFVGGVKSANELSVCKHQTRYIT